MSIELLYKHSRADAVEMDVLEKWQRSYRLNCDCKEAIEAAIREHFDGMHLDSKCVNEVFSEYGYDRTMWVLAATIRCKDYDGRFSNSNKKWAKGIITTDIPADEMRRYAVDSHPAVLDGFTTEVRKQYKALGLLDKKKCLADDKEYAEKLLILKPTALIDEFRKPYFQYFYAQSGFGCYPDKLGGKVFGKFLADSEDCCFHRSDFLGVADTEQLPQWAQKRLEQLTAPKMRIRVFQIDDSRDSKNLMFSSHEAVMKSAGVDAEIYRQVYGGVVNCSDLEGVFSVCNTDFPAGYYGRSLSVSDVVEICDGEQKGFYYCDVVGFQKIDFDISKVNRSDMLRILICETGKEPYEAEIRDELEAKQSVVGGLIEPVYFTRNDKVLVYCDEEFLLKGYEPNRKVGDTIIYGTFMVVGNGENECGEGIEVSLTDEQINEYSKMFRYPLIYMTQEELADNQAEEPDEGISQI
ncbi:MAG: DUF3849 domain-containing protein [Ruminococcus sp.]|nr:DUF3849 domain-containing protein [Ruminococcus sp.]